MYKIYVKGAKNCVAIMQLSSVKGLLTLPFVWFRNICPKPRFIGIIHPEYLLYLCRRNQAYRSYEREKN